MKVIRDDDKWIEAITEALLHVHMGMAGFCDGVHVRRQDFDKLSTMLEMENLRRFAGKKPLVDRPDGRY